MILGRRRLPLSCLFVPLLGRVCVESLIATVGSDITLTCTYNAQTHGRPPACWGRAALSYWDCSDEVIKTDGTAVTRRLSNRYLLLGDIAKGDISLTIRQVEEGDSGTYGCRVEIPGWFNDHTHEVILTVVPAPPNPLMIETRELRERTVTVGWSPVFDGGRPITSYRIYLKHRLASWRTAVKFEVSNPDLTQLTLADLRPAKNYNLRMFAINSVGRSESSNVLTITTKEAAPEGPPLDLQLEALTSNSIKVTWKPPSSDLRNGVLRSYSISYREYVPAGGQFERLQHQNVMVTGKPQSVVLSGLKPATIYSVHVQACTNAGVGPATTDLCSTLDEVQTASRTEMSLAAATTSFTSEVLTTSSFKEVAPQSFSVGVIGTLEELISLLGVGNIGRIAAIFLFTIIIILVFIFQTRLLPKDSLQHAETIYDDIQSLESRPALTMTTPV